MDAKVLFDCRIGWLGSSPELDEMIDRAHSKHLRETGDHCTRAEYIRRMLQTQCDAKLSEDKVSQ